VGANCDINQASKQAIKQRDKTWETLQPGVEGNFKIFVIIISVVTPIQ